MVNNVGLVNVIIDSIKPNSSKLDNFLDISGNITKEKITKTFKVIFLHEKVTVAIFKIFI